MSTALVGVRSSGIGTVNTVVGGYTAPAVTTGVVITGLTLANTSVNSIIASVWIFNGTTNFFIVKNTTILPGGSLAVADEGNRIVLNSGDQVQAVSSVSSSLDAIMSVSQIT